jgi:NAD(P)-dependent dehydrogenase (short-subunit alcohol dehydrogenase family)
MTTTNNLFDITGTNILLTGADGFLGRYFAPALRTAGANVITSDIKGEVDFHLDVTNPASVEAVFQEITKTLPLHVVINNAAINPKFDPDSPANTRLFENYPHETLRLSLDVNLHGYVLVAQAAIRSFLARKTSEGHIINLSSIYGLVGPNQDIYPPGTQKPVDYAVTKGGIIMLTKWLATTYGSRNIRANTLSYGGVIHNHDQQFLANYSQHTPLKRMMQPEETTGPLLFLCSPAASYMTGANLIVDGGWTAW